MERHDEYHPHYATMEGATVQPPQNQTSIMIGDHLTDIICTTYVDRHFVVISQLQKLGTLIAGRAEDRADGSKLYFVDVILGKRDDPLLTVYARQLLEKISTVSSKPLLLAITLHSDSRSPKHFQQILNSVLQIGTW